MPNFQLQARYLTSIGILLRKMVDDIQEHQTGKMPQDRKAFLFGSHEVNVAAVAFALGTNEPVIPAYGSTIILETLRGKTGLYYVRVHIDLRYQWNINH